MDGLLACCFPNSQWYPANVQTGCVLYVRVRVDAGRQETSKFIEVEVPMRCREIEKGKGGELENGNRTYCDVKRCLVLYE